VARPSSCGSSHSLRVCRDDLEQELARRVRLQGLQAFEPRSFYYGQHCAASAPKSKHSGVPRYLSTLISRRHSGARSSRIIPTGVRKAADRVVGACHPPCIARGPGNNLHGTDALCSAHQQHGIEHSIQTAILLSGLGQMTAVKVPCPSTGSHLDENSRHTFVSMSLHVASRASRPIQPYFQNRRFRNGELDSNLHILSIPGLFWQLSGRIIVL
jgi:hypothetical protein